MLVKWFEVSSVRWMFLLFERNTFNYIIISDDVRASFFFLFLSQHYILFILFYCFTANVFCKLIRQSSIEKN